MAERPYTSPADQHRYTPAQWTDMRLFDTALQDGDRPTLLLVTEDGRRARCQLTPRDALRLVKNLSGYLGPLWDRDHAPDSIS